jgi:hypothetical protein
MTREEFKKTNDYKLLTRALTSNYPWILGIEPDNLFEEWWDRFETLISFNIVISMEKFLQSYPYMTPYDWTIYRIDKEGFFSSQLGASYYCEDEGNCPKDGIKIHLEVDDFCQNSLERASKVLPKGLLSGRKRVSIYNFISLK